MDAEMADRLAASMDPKALAQLQNRNSDPAVARAVAAQFGSFLMQGMMQDSDGSAMSMAGGGTGSAAVSSMFASAMGRYAMSGDKLGLADQIYRSMAAKGGAVATPQGANADGEAAPAQAPAPTNGAISPTQGGGISLTPYWLDRGHRPIGAPIGHMNQPAGARTLGKTPAAVAVATHPVVAAATPAVAASPAAVKNTVAPVATPVASSSPPHRPAHARWAGLSLPAQAHVLLPPAEADPPVASTTASAAPSPTPAASAPGPAAVNGAGGAPIPYGLPWTHHKGGVETGAPARHDVAASGTGMASLNQAENFAEEVAPAIEHAAARLGVSPRVLLAQAALETGWGHSVVGNNIFGIKAGASWTGATVTAGTHEMEGGHLVAHQASFRSYANVDQAVDDYASLVSASDRYRAALGSGDNVAAYAQALTAGGYASDRDYAAKLMAVANSSKMTYAVASLEDETPGRLISAHS